MNANKKLGRFLIVALALALGWSFGLPHAAAGPVIISGLDPEDHDIEGVVIISEMMDYVVSNSVLYQVEGRPAPTRVLQLGGTGGPIGGSLTDAALIAQDLGYTFTVATGASILTVRLRDYDAIYMPTDAGQLGIPPMSGYGLSEDDMAKINARAEDIRDFVNNGGGIVAFVQLMAGAYGWFPGGQLITVDLGFVGQVGLELTPEGAVILSEASLLRVQPYHLLYTGPPGFFGLRVLATQSFGNHDPIILGGTSSVCIGPFLVLSPETSTGVVCSSHTLSATARRDSAPCEAWPGIEVTFEVLSGPNAGIIGSAVTDSGGVATIEYTGGGVTGVDQIRASFINPETSAVMTSNLVTRTWVAGGDRPVIAQGASASLTVGRNSTCPNPANQLDLTATNPDGPEAALVWSIATPPATGTVSFIGGVTTGGAVTVCYQPNPNQMAADSFVVQVDDGCAGPSTITVQVTVQNAPPTIVQGDSIDKTVNLNSTCPNFSNRLQLDGTDPDGDSNTLVWSILSPPAHGTVTMLTSSPRRFVIVCYQPNPDQIMPDSFVVQVADVAGATDTIVVNITVVNQPPNIVQGNVVSITVEENSTCPNIANQVLLTATDPDGPAGALVWDVPTPAATGTVSFVGGNTGGAATLCYQPDPGQTAADSFVVRVTDPFGGTDTIVVQVIVTPLANCPTIDQGATASITVAEDSDCAADANNLTLTATDPDSPAANLTWSLATAPQHGAVSFVGVNGTTGESVKVCYTPVSDYSGPDSFVISVTDGECGGADSITVTVDVTEVPDCPEITGGGSATMTVNEDSTCADAANNLTLEASDVDTPAGSLSWSLVGDPGHGSVTFPGGQTGNSIVVCYTPNPDVTGGDSFVLEVDDGSCGTPPTITVSVTILEGDDDCPTIDQGAAASLTVPEDSTCANPANRLSLSATDPEGESALTWSVATPPAHGVVTFTASQHIGAAVEVCYTPNPNATGMDAFDIGVTDGTCGGTTIIAVSVTILDGDDDCPEISHGDTADLTVDEDSTCPHTANQLELSATDPDTPADSLTWDIATNPAHGAVTFIGGNTGGTVTVCYEPNPDYAGSDSFVVAVTDGGCGGDDRITVNVTILEGDDDCPTIDQGATAALTVLEDSTCANPANRLSLSATDPESQVLSWQVLTSPTQGAVSFLGGAIGSSVEVCYTPNPDVSGADSFVIAVTDGTCGGQDTISVAVTIVEDNPDCPSIEQGSSVLMTVAEDSTCGTPANRLALSAVDPDSPPGSLAWSLATPPTSGSVTFTGGQQIGAAVEICYTPNANVSGADLFILSVTDGTCGGNDTIVVNVTITEVPDCPVIDQSDPQSLTVTEDSGCGAPSNRLTLSATDVDTPPASLAWSLATSPTKGNVNFPDGTTGGSAVVCYTPNLNATGADSFTIQVNDGTCSDTLTVNVTITAVNDCPEISGPTTITMTVAEDSTCGDAANVRPVTAIDADTTPASLTWSASDPGKGSVSFPNGPTGATVEFCYTPDPDLTGSDSFTLTVSDGECEDTITVQVTITEGNDDCPTITQGATASMIVNEDSTCANDANKLSLAALDPEGQALTWSAAVAPALGSLSFPQGTTGAGIVVCYTPNPNATGSDAFVIAVTDGTCGGGDSITVNVTINEGNDDCPAIQQGDTLEMAVGEDSVCGDPGNTRTLSAIDPEGQTLTWRVSSTPSKGAVTFPNGATGGSIQVCYTPNLDETGDDTFMVAVTDGTCGGEDTITIHVTIGDTPDCPAIDQGDTVSLTVEEDSTCADSGNSLTLSAVDPDSPASALVWSIATPPTLGTTTFAGGLHIGTSVVVCYTPNANTHGSDSFVVQVDDGTCGEPTLITVNVTITPVEDCPVITQGGTASMTVAEDSTCASAANRLAISATDPDTPPASLAWSVSTPPTSGTVTFTGGQQSGAAVEVCYTPDPDATGADEFVVSVTDDACGTPATITVSVTITEIPDCPVITEGSTASLIVGEDSTCADPPNLLSLSATDPDSTSLAWNVSSAPSKGAVTFTGGNTGFNVEICYTPNPNATGADQFTVSVTDDNCGTPAVITVVVTITPDDTDCPEIEQGDTAAMVVVEDSTCADAANLLTLSATNPDETGLTWSLVTPPAVGTISFPDGLTDSPIRVCYTPNPNVTGADSFVVSVTDGGCDAPDTILVSVTIQPGDNDCPTIDQGATASLSVEEDSTCASPANRLTLSATDPDTPGSGLTWAVADSPSKGTVAFVGSSTGGSVELCYTPQINATGADSFDISVTDGNCGEVTTIAVEVSIAPVNDCPIIEQGSSVSITVQEDSLCTRGNLLLLTAFDPDDTNLAWTSTTPAKGQVIFVHGNTGPGVDVCYQPNPGEIGNDQFVVTVSDGKCDDTITVEVRINPLACPSIQGTGQVTRNVLEDSDCGGVGNTFELTAEDIDTPADQLAWSATAAAFGLVTFPNGTTGATVQICYTPNADAHGTDTFEVSVDDGTCGSDTVVVTVHVAPLPDCPAIDQGEATAMTVDEDSGCGDAPNVAALSATDPDGDALSWTISAQGGKGEASFVGGNVGTNVQICYTPAPNATGEDTFVVSVSDGTCTDTITVSVTITPGDDDCPTIDQGEMTAMTVMEDSTCAAAANRLTLSATDPEGQPLFWFVATGPARGTVTFPNGDTGGSVVVCYTPDADVTGVDTFQVAVTDDTCGGDPALITVNVTITPGDDDCPTIDQGDATSIGVFEDSTCADPANVLTLSATDIDSPPSALIWSVATPPAKGVVTFPSGNVGSPVQVCYTPNANATGADVFAVSVTDGGCGGSATITVSVMIEPDDDDCPEIIQGSSTAITVHEDSTCAMPANNLVLSATNPDGGVLTWSVSVPPTLGTVTFPNGDTGSPIQVCYTPNAGVRGGDSFVVAVTDGHCEVPTTISVAVTIIRKECPTISGAAEVNLNVVEDSTCASAANRLSLTATDPDSPLSSLVWSLTTTPAKGTTTFLGGTTGGTVQLCYTPNPNVSGQDIFVVSVTDGTCGGAAAVTVRVTISAGDNDCPQITQGATASLTVDEDSTCGAAANELTLNATDPDTPANLLQWNMATPPTRGAVSFIGGQSGAAVKVCYKPNPNVTGTDSFVISVTDGNCVRRITVSVTIREANPDCPTVQVSRTETMTVPQDATCGDAVAQVTFTATDIDTPPSELTWSIAVAPANGTLSFVGGVSTGAQATLCYVPNAGVPVGTKDEFTVAVSDGTCGTTVPTTVPVEVVEGEQGGGCSPGSPYLSLAMSNIFRAPVCGVGCAVMVPAVLLGLMAMMKTGLGHRSVSRGRRPPM